jgi:hypothetical protein
MIPRRFHWRNGCRNADPNDQHLAWSPWMMGSSDGWRDESGGRPVVWDNVAPR